MIFLMLMVFILVTSCAEESLEGYCDIKGESCEIANTSNKFILYDVNPPEGFNLRRDVYMRFAIMLVESRKREKNKNWKLVLPPWYKLYHWKTDNYLSESIPWGKFFDLESLKKFAPVVELYEVFQHTSKKYLEIDRLYVLQNFENAFENGIFDDKWEIDDNCDFSKNFWGYKNITVKETICVKFQGKISKLWELVNLHQSDQYVMFAHGEIPLHDYYGSKEFWDCRRSMKFNKNLLKRAKDYILDTFNCDKEKCDSYISVHWRRQDFARSRKRDVPSIEGTVKQINKAVKNNNPNIVNIFVASDAEDSELNHLKSQLKRLGYRVHFYTPTVSDLAKFKDGGIAIIEQVICSHAAYFIGTHESTFTFRIQEEREIIGFDSSTTFNRLCPDTGKCERPSKWTIVK